jgi:hypothetical protein
MASERDEKRFSPARLLRGILPSANSQPFPLAWITSDIAVSAAPGRSDWPSIEAAGLRAVLDLRAEIERLVPAHRLIFRHLPIEEGGAPGVEVLQDAAGWVVTQIGEAGPVLVHCREGRGRSPMVACAALIVLGYSAADAYDLLRRGQPLVAMSESQVAAIEAFAALKGRPG